MADLDLDALDRRVAAMLAKQLRSRVCRDDEDGQLYVGLNDLFHAAADAEMIPPDEVAYVVTRWETQGWFGILDWVIQRRYIVPALRGTVEERDQLEKRLDELAALPENWNTYGAPRITPEAIAAARGWLKGLNVWPRNDGGLMLGRDEDYEDVHIEPDGKFSARDDEPSEVLVAEVAAGAAREARLREAATPIVRALEQVESRLPAPLGGHLTIDARWSDLTVGDLRALRAALAGAATP